MNYYVCQDCEESEPCFSVAKDNVMPPDVCLFTKANAKWEKVSRIEFYDKLSKAEEKARNDKDK